MGFPVSRAFASALVTGTSFSLSAYTPGMVKDASVQSHAVSTSTAERRPRRMRSKRQHPM